MVKVIFRPFICFLALLAYLTVEISISSLNEQPGSFTPSTPSLFSPVRVAVQRAQAFQVHHSLWSLLSNTFRLPRADEQPEVQAHINWFSKHPSYLQDLITKGQPYLYYVYNEVTRRNLPGEIALLPMIESSYNPFAYSGAGAAGLWQIMPETGLGYGLKQNWWYDGRRDVYASTQAALDYIEYLNTLFGGRWYLALAAYNWGQGNVQQAVEDNHRHGRGTEFWSLSLPHETRSYVPRLLALAEIIRHPGRYHITLPDVPAKPYFTQVDIGFQIDLPQAAKLAGISLKELYRLNPGYNRWTTTPNGPHKLVLPVETVGRFREGLSYIATTAQKVWQKYVVKRGENLNTVANRVHATAESLKSVNQLKNIHLHSNQVLVVPKITGANSNNTTLINFEKDSSTALSSSKNNKKTYIVHSGDTLSRISKHYHVSVTQIKSWNSLIIKKPLRAGQRLSIFV